MRVQQFQWPRVLQKTVNIVVINITVVILSAVITSVTVGLAYLWTNTVDLTKWACYPDKIKIETEKIYILIS